MNQRVSISLVLLSAALASCGRHEPAPLPAAPTAAVTMPPIDEASIAQLQAEMTAGHLTARTLTEHYLARIEAIDRTGPTLNSIIELNPDALTIADALDAERKAKGPRGPLHGIPVLLKDNIGTADAMQTTAGSLALVGHKPPRDAFIVERLRAAGAVILGKTNLSEWANFRSTHSTSGWSGRGGQTRNPYALDRNPCGSSSGSGAAIAANLASVAVGTETDGSIVCPSSVNGLVGIKPTRGLVSRAGIIPLSESQDTAGPMARSVADAATLLAALAGADPRDPATKLSTNKAPAPWPVTLDADALKGARIGVARKMAGFHPAVDALFDQAIETLKAAGAVIVEGTEITTQGQYDKEETTVLLFEFKVGIKAWLAELDSDAPKSLAELIAFNTREAGRELSYFGQELFEQAQATTGLDAEDYKTARARSLWLAGTQGIDATLTTHHLDAIIAPTMGVAWVTDTINGDHFVGGGASSAAAVAGYPHITVPAGLVRGLPVGISFIGTAWSDARLISYAYAYENLSRARRPPTLGSTIP